jgi:hypothetical protein
MNKMYQKRCILGHIIESMFGPKIGLGRHFLGGNLGDIMKYIV